MTETKLLRTIAMIENLIPPWGEELGKLVSLDRLICERSTIHHHGIGRPRFELSAVEATLYLHRLHALSWAIVLFWKPKNFSIYAPNGQREAYKPLGAVFAACMDLCEKLHSLEKFKTYRSGAEWFRLIVEEQEIEGISTGLGKTEDIRLLQKQNSQLADQECPFTKPHTERLIELSIKYQESGRIEKSYRSFVSARKKWATAFKGKNWKSLINYEETIATAPNGRQKPKQIKPLFFGIQDPVWEPISDD